MHCRLVHGVGRSGDIAAEQPKAAGMGTAVLAGVSTYILMVCAAATFVACVLHENMNRAVPLLLLLLPPCFCSSLSCRLLHASQTCSTSG
jgi:hypothetical protein